MFDVMMKTVQATHSKSWKDFNHDENALSQDVSGPYNIISAIGQDDFEKWLKNQEADLTEMSEGEVKALASITKEFETYSEEQDRLYNAFKKVVEEK